ncbi:MAG: bacteriohemerythrin [Bacteroidota bacterium]|jgi:hemerythrin
MKTIEWQDEYTVGVKELDDQHQSLLNMINTLLEEQRDKYEAAKFSPALSSLIHYAYTHFATEERYLLQVHFPDLKQHVLEHIDFIMKTVGFALRIESSGDELRIELLRYLKEWYSSHVLGTDRHYIPFLATKKNI